MKTRVLLVTLLFCLPTISHAASYAQWIGRYCTAYGYLPGQTREECIGTSKYNAAFYEKKILAPVQRVVLRPDLSIAQKHRFALLNLEDLKNRFVKNLGGAALYSVAVQNDSYLANIDTHLNRAIDLAKRDQSVELNSAIQKIIRQLTQFRSELK